MGRRLGDPSNPLLVSVRSGAAVSMPGMMETFLNVGMNPQIAAGFAERIGSPWAAWDAYRRFLQFWGMSFGVERDRFDELIAEMKDALGVPKKAQLPPERMKELAFRYADLVRDHGVEIVEEPFEQLLRCIELVQGSWHSGIAKAYRQELHIADEWGTAVVVQSMVFGNVDERSGTGVVFTRHPRHGGEDVRLYGDCIFMGQGDDVVGGLVDTFPISERQRVAEGTRAAFSLEKNMPAIYSALLAYATTLIEEYGMQHQEIEFTFESDDPSDLYILQTRDIVFAERPLVTTFVPSADLDHSLIATGIGVGGGAIAGRVAHTLEEVRRLRETHPGDPVIVLRPDTVPDDLPLILAADGLLTALGGATSHAAVAAQALGKICVVGCRYLNVSEITGRSTVGDHSVRTGDFLSISGTDGSVYLGRQPVSKKRRSQLALDV